VFEGEMRGKIQPFDAIALWVMVDPSAWSTAHPALSAVMTCESI
jgi:hypothetical protein